MNAETTVARLRMEVITPTRIVRRVVDVSTKTGLQTVAAIIRSGRGWWEDRHYRFHFGDERYADGNNRGANVRQAKGKALGEALGENRTFDFLHDITGGTGQTIVIESITRSSKPETAYPVLVEAAGTLALPDLTPHDSAHHWVKDADDLYAHSREYAIEMTMDEATRAEHDLFGIGVAIDSIRLSRRGPLRSHREGSARNPTSHGLKPEPETEPPSYRTQGTHMTVSRTSRSRRTARPHAAGRGCGRTTRTTPRRAPQKPASWLAWRRQTSPWSPSTAMRWRTPAATARPSTSTGTLSSSGPGHCQTSSAAESTATPTRRSGYWTPRPVWAAASAATRR